MIDLLIIVYITILCIVSVFGVTGFYYRKYGAEYDRYLLKLNYLGLGLLVILWILNFIIN